MKHFFTVFPFFLLLAAGCTGPEAEGGAGSGDGSTDLVPPEVTLHQAFTENFEEEVPEYFSFNYRTSREDFRYYSGVPSYTERNTDILMLRIDPADPAGSERGSVVLSDLHTFYGTYSARIRVPDIRRAQPNAAAIVGFSVQDEDPSFGRSEIAFQWRIANPEILYMRTVTGVSPEQNTLTKIIDLAGGIVCDASYCSETVQKNGTSVISSEGGLSGAQNGPGTFAPIEGFDASARFYVYGFDWYPDRITWWIRTSDSDEKTVLWDYEGASLFPGRPSETGIPVIPSRCRLDFWHSKISPVEGNPASVEAPLYPYELEVDMASYEPYEDLIKAWQEKHFN